MSYVPENPLIEFVERNGHAPWQKPAVEPVCPICGKECETFYTKKSDGEFLGCDNCIASEDAYPIEYDYEPE